MTLGLWVSNDTVDQRANRRHRYLTMQKRILLVKKTQMFNVIKDKKKRGIPMMGSITEIPKITFL